MHRIQSMLMGPSPFAKWGLFKTELLTRLRFFLEESETGTRAQARGLTSTQVPQERLARWCSDAPAGDVHMPLSYLSVGTPGRMGLRWRERKAARPGVSDPQLLPPKEERQGVRVMWEEGPVEHFIPEVSKFTPSSYRNQTLITRAREWKRKKPDEQTLPLETSHVVFRRKLWNCA